MGSASSKGTAVLPVTAARIPVDPAHCSTAAPVTRSRRKRAFVTFINNKGFITLIPIVNAHRRPFIDDVSRFTAMPLTDSLQINGFYEWLKKKLCLGLPNIHPELIIPKLTAFLIWELLDIMF
jgi:hypothetical protein